MGCEIIMRYRNVILRLKARIDSTNLGWKFETSKTTQESLKTIPKGEVGDSFTTLTKLINFMGNNAKDSQGNLEPVDVVVYSGFIGLFDILVHSLVLHGIVIPRKDLIGRLSEIKETAWFLKRPKAPVMGHRKIGGSGMFQMIQIYL